MQQLPVYPYRRPRELDVARAEPHPVAIVGAGLSGLTAALDLARRGVRVVVLDDDNTVGVRGLASRGMVWAQRTLDIFERLGVAGAVVSKGVRWNLGRVLCRDEAVTCFRLQEQPDVRHNGFANLQQYYVEKFLVEALQREPLAELRWLNQVQAVKPLGDCVELQVATPDGGYRTRAQWVLACDGAHSGVRTALGLQPQVYDRTEDRWIIIDIVLRTGRWPEERWTWLDAGANGGRAVWRHKMADDTWRLDFQLAPGEDAGVATTEAAMRARVARLVGEGVDFDIAWSGAWSYRHECLEQMRSGRVFFVGDAAHLVAPFGARGGNGGIQDADNLGWKLALHLQGQAGDVLIDSYAHERRHAALENIRQARRAARFVHPGPQASAALWREAIIALAPSHDWAARMVNTGRLCMPAVYPASRLVRSGTALAGMALPNVVLRREAAGAVSLHALLGPWFTALVMDDEPPPWRPSHPLLQWVAVGRHCDGAGRAALRRQLQSRAGEGAAVWLIRPDQHVMAVVAADALHTIGEWLHAALGQEDSVREEA
ncbi:3-(3-hydroxy-phenyl)propionate/3-hydroxycinnamic acid hydroxylase [Delftia tsuruhatensis]|uniref:FAD-dependent oxidoreductase n=1 Tax=Delftia tsuruhatensis TaxID=180282 RepID=UPI001E70B0AC|nr:FAD-dependent oxidoreductase [Delftia tsuruhatensis]CAB5691370.1 3-(3-hydroxy-phenyl)propionate/3-hydroxycinnamic acid hydroxylase [Delftia tsuruhatensis]CAC9676896.1 3-(3-hydroxy-phenyl)propionate/3-hydroxycinnamic acid hydroxylase [Delftia tsuruhatensis]